MKNRSVWKSATIASLVALTAMSSAPGQQAPGAAKPEETVNLEKFVVTGSMIKRLDSEGALPVQVITPIELEQRGVSSAEQMLMEMNINGRSEEHTSELQSH